MVGQKVKTQTGELTVKAQKIAFPIIDPFKEISDVNVYQLSARYSLSFVVRVSKNILPFGSVLHEQTVYVGETGRDNHCLESLSIPLTDKDLRSDWTAEEVIEKRKIAEKAKEIARNAENDCFPFGLSDR
jgi:hypothetical protein